MNLDEFSERLYRGLSHRKRELTHLNLELQESEPDVQRSAWVTRSAVCLAYAHWEGFVKEASIKYLKLINSLGIRVESLKLPLQAACLSSHFRRAENVGKGSALGLIIADMDGCRTGIFAVDAKKIVDTQSNLSSLAFREVVLCLGLEYFPSYEMRQNFLDSKLLKSRNQVAHGELIQFTVSDADERIRGVVDLIDEFADHLVGAARDESYLM